MCGGHLGLSETGGPARTTSLPSTFEMSRADAVGDWSLFPDKETTLAQVDAAPETEVGSRSDETSAAKPGVAVHSQNSFKSPVGEQGSDRLSLGRGKQNEKKGLELIKSKDVPSPLDSGVHFKEEDDLEAARGTQPPTTSKSLVGAMPGEAANDEFEVTVQPKAIDDNCFDRNLPHHWKASVADRVLLVMLYHVSSG